MRWQTKVKPPNREHYLDRCVALKRCLNMADAMPPVLIVANCLFVLQKALGGNWRILRWLLLSIAHDWKERRRERIWFGWHYYIRCRTRDEITELIDQELEEMTGEDHREWPSVISVDSAEVDS